jgi:hypothetical protein
MVCKNCSRRLGRAYFSKLGWQANVIWRIAISIYIPFDASTVRVDDLIRDSLKEYPHKCRNIIGITGSCAKHNIHLSVHCWLQPDRRNNETSNHQH